METKETTTNERKTDREQSFHQNRNQNPQKKRMFFYRKKVCKICTKDFSGDIDYKNTNLLRKFITEKGKIIPRRLSGVCAKHQRVLTVEIKKARTIAFFPFVDK